MSSSYAELMEQLYGAFNARKTDDVLSVMSTQVHWPNGWEGGYVNGQEEVRSYWNRQWQEVNPIVKPIAVHEREDGKVAVTVHQLVKDMTGNTIFDGTLTHLYTFDDNGLITEMTISK